MSDSDIILRMLYFCEEPRMQFQIMSYCRIDGIRFRKFSEHCLKRGILKFMSVDHGSEAFVITSRGREVLETAEEIIRALDFEAEPGIDLR